MKLLLLCPLLLFTGVCSNPEGAPFEACVTMTPGHFVGPQPDGSYTIEAEDNLDGTFTGEGARA